MPLVAPVAHCIAPDLIGFGQSGKPGIGYRFADQVRYLDAFLAKAEISSAFVIAHDWGSALAFHLAARKPQIIRSLLLWSSSGQCPPGRILTQLDARHFRSSELLGWENK